MKIKNVKLILSSVFASIILTSCYNGQSSEEGSRVSTVVDEDGKLTWKNFKICWLNGSADSVQFRQQLFSFAASEFAKIGLNLTQYDACDGVPADTFKIFIFDEPKLGYNTLAVKRKPYYANLRKMITQIGTMAGHPQASEIGVYALAYPVSMILSMNLNSVYVEQWLSSEIKFINKQFGAAAPARIMNYQKNIFLHELGHLLGLYHEFDHPDYQVTDCPTTEAYYQQIGKTLGWTDTRIKAAISKSRSSSQEERKEIMEYSAKGELNVKMYPLAKQSIMAGCSSVATNFYQTAKGFDKGDIDNLTLLFKDNTPEPNFDVGEWLQSL